MRAFPERMAAAFGPDFSPLCAAGIRTEADGFFSERYLHAPIERALSLAGPGPVLREQIIEVTSLASERPGHAFTLIDFIIQLGRVEGRTWGIFTATEKLRRCLTRGGLAFSALATARADLAPNSADWGRYYDSNPMVCAMHDHQENPISFRPLRSRPIETGDAQNLEARSVD